MTRPQVEDEKNGPQIWRVAANILKKTVAYSRQGVVLQLGSWVWDSQLLAVENKFVTKCYEGPRTLTDSMGH
jgi:hypothetical protein